MRFNHNGAEYEFDFTRTPKDVRIGVDEHGNDIYRPSRFPYTTVRLWRQRPDILGPELYREATVGAWHKEQFTFEKGRIHALRALSLTLSKAERSLVWNAYMNRPKTQKPKPVITLEG